MNKFHHRGSLGDIIYSLPLIFVVGGGDLYLRKKNHYNFLYSLLKKQSCINNVFCEEDLIEEESSDIFNGIINLDEFRKIHKKDLHKHLAICHLEILKQKFDLSELWLSNIIPNHKAKIVINRTSRYHDKEEIDWELLKKYEKDCLFVGLKKEYKSFLNKNKIDMPYYECKDGLEMASIIRGSSLAIGNQSVFFAIAEALKHPRVLEVCYNKNNCQPQSNNGYTYLNKEIIQSYIEVE